MTDQDNTEQPVVQYSAFNYLSLLRFCRHVPSTDALLATPNAVYVHKPAHYDYFGPPDSCQPDDLPNIDEHNSETDYTNPFLFITKRLHHLVDDVFLASLDNVQVQHMSLGRERFHVLLDKGIVAAESYTSARTCEGVSQQIGEKMVLSAPSGPLSFNAYQVCEPDFQVDVPCVLISHMWMHTYAHWLLEVLPRLWYLKAAPELAHLPIIVPPYPEGSFQDQTLKALAGDRPRIWPFGNVGQFRKLIFPSFYGMLSRLQIEWLNTNLREGLGITVPPGRNLKIYVSRADSPVRRIKDEEQLVERLSALGFSTHILSGLSVRQQIELFSQADTIVTAHGANCANLVFAPPGAKVIELVPASYIHPMYWFLSKLAGHFYGRVICPDEGPQKLMTLDFNALVSALEALDRAGDERNIRYPLT